MFEKLKPMLKLVGGTLLVLFILWALLHASESQAGTATVSWTHPTQRVNGSTLALSEIASTRVEYSIGTTFGTVTGTQSVAAPATTLTIGSLTDGATYCFRAFTVTTDGSISASSTTQPCKVIPASPPNPPVLTTVVTTAYELREHWYGDRMVVVGKVDRGEVCGAQWSEKPVYAQLTRTQVNVKRNYKGGLLYGKCA